MLTAGQGPLHLLLNERSVPSALSDYTRDSNMVADIETGLFPLLALIRFRLRAAGCTPPHCILRGHDPLCSLRSSPTSSSTSATNPNLDVVQNTDIPKRWRYALFNAHGTAGGTMICPLHVVVYAIR